MTNKDIHIRFHEAKTWFENNYLQRPEKVFMSSETLLWLIRRFESYEDDMQSVSDWFRSITSKVDSAREGGAWIYGLKLVVQDSPPMRDEFFFDIEPSIPLYRRLEDRSSTQKVVVEES